MKLKELIKLPEKYQKGCDEGRNALIDQIGDIDIDVDQKALADLIFANADNRGRLSISIMQLVANNIKQILKVVKK